MSDDNSLSPEAWQQVIQNTELRAMSGTLIELGNLLGNDGITVNQLASIIQKDVMLTSRVLTAANSVNHASRRKNSGKKGALSQAIERIGFNGLRAVCISAAIMDSFLDKMPNRVQMLSCISGSFDVAVHAKNVAEKTGAQCENVFIAGLLQNLGELMFWGSSIPASPQYKALLERAVDTPEQAFKRLSGMDFRDMSKTLASQWQISEILTQSFGTRMTPDTKAVHLGKRIASAIQEGWDSPSINKLLQSQLSDLGLDIISGMKFMRDGADEAKRLAEAYQLEQELAVEPVDIYNKLQERSAAASKK